MLAASSTGVASAPRGTVRFAGTHASPVLRPATFVARTTSSRGRDLSQLPTISDVRPWVSGAGFTGYISAVSRKFTPRSNAASSCRCPSASVFCCPNVIVPRHTSLTSSPPSLRRGLASGAGEAGAARAPAPAPARARPAMAGRQASASSPVGAPGTVAAAAAGGSERSHAASEMCVMGGAGRGGGGAGVAVQ